MSESITNCSRIYSKHRYRRLSFVFSSSDSPAIPPLPSASFLCVTFLLLLICSELQESRLIRNTHRDRLEHDVEVCEKALSPCVTVRFNKCSCAEREHYYAPFTQTGQKQQRSA